MEATVATHPALCDQCGGSIQVEEFQDFTECQWCGVILRVERTDPDLMTEVASLDVRTTQLELTTDSLSQQVAELRGHAPKPVYEETWKRNWRVMLRRNREDEQAAQLVAAIALLAPVLLFFSVLCLNAR